MTAPRLILHVGHPKTGSSALQSSFALSVAALAQAGIHYPRPIQNNAARAGHITSGNFNPARVVELYDRAVTRKPDARGILFSNEACFRLYLADAAPLHQLAARGVAVEVILFIRDPLGLAVSTYAQMLKRGGATIGFEDFLPKFRFMAQVERFLALMHEAEATLRVRNYARCRDRLLPETEELLGVPICTLTQPPVARVNRSLTRAEMDLLRRLNGTLPDGHARHVADALCHELPLLTAEMPALSLSAYEGFVARMAPILVRLNAALPEAEHLRMEPYDSRFEALREPLTLTRAQQVVVERAISEAASSAGWGEAAVAAVRAAPVRRSAVRDIARFILRR